MSIKSNRSCIHLQILMGLYFLGQNVMSVILSDYIIYAACKSRFDPNEFNCDTLHVNSTSDEVLEVERSVQPEVSSIITVRAGLESVLIVFIVLSLGSWSDRNGRKPILALVVLGPLLKVTGITVLSFTNANPWFILLTSMPVLITGGYSVMVITSYIYLCDVTDLSNRSWQLSLISLSSYCGGLVGDITGSLIYDRWGYSFAFMTSAVIFGITYLYTIYFVPESLSKRNNEPITSVSEMYVTCWQLFDIKLLKDALTAVIRKREGFNLRISWICILYICLGNFGDTADLAFKYLFTSARLGWGVDEYAHYTIASGVVIWIFGLYLGTKILRPYMGKSEALACAIFNISSVGNAFTKAFVWKSWHMYLSLIIGVFRGCGKPMIRSILSTAVPADDIGKVFALSSSLEIIVSVSSISLNGVIYSHTMPPVYPSPLWLLQGGLYIIQILLLISIHIIQKHEQR